MEIVWDSVREARAVLIAGATASGKSRTATALVEMANRYGRTAIVINADSMQVYDAIPLLTAQPGAAERSRVAHRLYGHVDAARRYSVGAWLADAATVLVEAERERVLPVFVGGTGLYFRALTLGLAPVPPVPGDVRAFWTARRAAGASALHAELTARDPLGAAHLRPADAQRVQRALEVLDASGRPLAEWQRATDTPPLLPLADSASFVLETDRAALVARIEARVDRMVEQGVVDEVAALLARGLDPNLPAMKAIGVTEFAACLRGELTLDAATTAVKVATRRYAKRQATWLRNQMGDWPRLPV